MARNNKKFDKKKSNGKKNFRKNEDRDTLAAETDSKRGQNDWQWYASNPQLLTDAASLSFYNRLGDTISLDGGTNGPGSLVVPGVARLGVVPTYGSSTDYTSAINMSAQVMYSYIRHANSGSRNYESSDLMMYLMGMDSIYSYLTWMTRAYGTMMLYSQLNTYMPKAYLAAMNVDFDSIQANMANFRWYINQYAAKASVFAVPNKFTMYTRHSWMYSNIYLDSADAKAQAYIFAPDLFLKYSPKTDTHGGELIPVYIKNSTNYSEHPLLTFEEIVTRGNELLNSMLGDEDCGIISGDIIKAFGTNLHSVSMIGDDYTVVPVYNTEVLSQINNATALGHVSEYEFKQDGNVILTKVKTKARASLPAFDGRRIINMKAPNGTDPASVMVATRLCVPASNSNNQTTEGVTDVTPLTYGSEIITTIDIIREAVDGSGLVYSNPGLTYVVDSAGMSAGWTVFQLMQLGYFDWHPMVINATTSETMGTQQWVMGDLDNYTAVDDETLKKMHDCALLNMFAVPEFGTLIR